MTNGAGVKFGTLTEEDPNEPQSNSETVVEPERVLSAEAEGMDIPMADRPPLAVSPTPVFLRSPHPLSHRYHY